MNAILRAAACAVVLAGLAGCSTGPRYAPPSGTTAETGATVIGTRSDGASMFDGDLRTYLQRVDGVGAGVNLFLDGPERPVLVEAGEHVLDIGMSRKHGLAGGPGYFGSGSVRVTLESGKTYRLRSQFAGETKGILSIEEDGREVARGDALIGSYYPEVFVPIPVKK
jgi:hypothetical protein